MLAQNSMSDTRWADRVRQRSREAWLWMSGRGRCSLDPGEEADHPRGRKAIRHDLQVKMSLLTLRASSGRGSLLPSEVQEMEHIAAERLLTSRSCTCWCLLSRNLEASRQCGECSQRCLIKHDGCRYTYEWASTILILLHTREFTERLWSN